MQKNTQLPLLRVMNLSLQVNYYYSIKGDLTLRGVTQPVTLDTVLKPNTVNPQLLDVKSKAVVNRSDFGMKKAFGGIGEQVNIEVDGQWRKRQFTSFKKTA